MKWPPYTAFHLGLHCLPKYTFLSRHCVMSLSKTLLSLLSTGSSQEDPSSHNGKNVDWGVKNQIKQTFLSH